MEVERMIYYQNKSSMFFLESGWICLVYQWIQPSDILKYHPLINCIDIHLAFQYIDWQMYVAY